MRNVQDPVAAAKVLVDQALARFSTDNLSCMIVRFDKQALLENQNNKENPIGVEGDSAVAPGRVSETDLIVNSTKQKIAEGGSPAVGVSASNSGRGHEPVPVEDGESSSFVPTMIEGPVEEEPSSIDDSPEVTPSVSVTNITIDAPKKEKPDS